MKNSRLHKTINRILDMTDTAWSVLSGTLLVCCALVFSALVIIIGLGELSTSNYHLYMSAMELVEAPPALLLAAILVSVCIEERLTDK